MGGFFSGFGFGDLLGGVTSVAGSIANVVTSKKARKWQSQENERQRQYMSELASRQNQWNLEQWNRENAYNSPSNKMKLLKEAGLNPDLMYGQGAGSLQAASSPQMTAGEAAPPMDYSKFMPNLELSSIAQNMANARLADAQARLANSQANKTDTENAGLKIENLFKPDLLTQTVENMKKDGRLTDNQSSEILSHISVLNNQSNYWREQYQIAHLEGEKLQREKNYWDENFRSMADKLRGEADAAALQAFFVLANTFNLMSNTALNEAQTEFIRTHKDGQDIINGINAVVKEEKERGNETFKDAPKWLQKTIIWCGIVAPVFGELIGGFANGAAGVRTATDVVNAIRGRSNMSEEEIFTEMEGNDGKWSSTRTFKRRK